MKIVRRITISLFVLVVAFFMFLGIKANATPVTTNDQIEVLGAGVRTSGNAGIRFVGSVGTFDTTNVKAYGIAIAFGEVDVDSVVLGATVNGKSVLTATDDALDESGYFYVVLYGVPEASYTQDVTARAYVVLNDDSVVYAATKTTRNLAEVAIKAKNSGIDGGLIDLVVASVKELKLSNNDLAKITASNATKVVSTLATGTDGDKFVVTFDDNLDNNRTFTFGTDLFATFEAANAALVDDDVLYFANGLYSLSSSIVKRVTLAGPNYGVEGKNHSDTDYAQIDFAAVAINATYFEANGIKVQDTSHSYKTNNNQFVVAANTKEVIFRNVYFNNLANIMRYTNVGAASTVADGTFTVENCLINDLSQFVVNVADTYGETLKEVRIINNKFTGSHNGYMGGYGTIRIQGGGVDNTYVLNNDFDTDLESEAKNKYFRNQHGNFYVMFNKFNNITKFNDANSSLPIVYYCNLYLDGSSNVLNAAPDQVALNQGVKDILVASSEEQRVAFYNAYLANEVSSISFNNAGDTPIDALNYVEGLPSQLPVPTKSGYDFLGWTVTVSGDDYVTVADTVNFTGDVTLYGQYAESLEKELEVSNAEAAKLNEYLPDIIVKGGLTSGNYTLINAGLDSSFATTQYAYGVSAFDTIADALSSLTTNGKKIFVFAGTYTETLNINYGVTIDCLSDVNIGNVVNVTGGITGLTLKNLTFKNRLLFGGAITDALLEGCSFQATSTTNGTITVSGAATNFVVNNCTGSFNAARAFKFDGLSSYITFTNNTFTGWYTLNDSGVYSTGVCDMIRFYGGIQTSLVIRNNVIDGVGQTVVFADAYKGGTFVFEDNTFTDFHRAGIEFRGPASTTGSPANFAVTHNTFKDADNGWGTIRVETTGISSGAIAIEYHYNILETLGSYAKIVARKNGSLTAYANCDKNYSDTSLTDSNFDASASSHADWFDNKADLEAEYSALS